MGEGGRVEVGCDLHKDTGNSAVSSLSDKNEYNS